MAVAAHVGSADISKGCVHFHTQPYLADVGEHAKPALDMACISRNQAFRLVSVMCKTRAINGKLDIDGSTIDPPLASNCPLSNDNQQLLGSMCIKQSD